MNSQEVVKQYIESLSLNLVSPSSDILTAVQYQNQEIIETSKILLTRLLTGLHNSFSPLFIGTCRCLCRVLCSLSHIQICETTTTIKLLQAAHLCLFYSPTPSQPCPYPLVTTNLFSTSIVLLFHKGYINAIIQYCNLLTSFHQEECS